jgi:tRNA (cmo5U34)-methyltransferase
MKSTVDEIRARFDKDVERFSSLETGQSAIMDAPLTLELICSAAAAVTPRARRLLDVGCGAGNYSLKMLQKIPDLDVTLIDLSRPMLDRAAERIRAATRGTVSAVQSDIREANLGEGQFDIIVAGAVLHHLRETSEWQSVFAKFHRSLSPGGSIWICDMVDHEIPQIGKLLTARYGEYLAKLKDPAYRDQVFAYVAKEDSPRSLTFQIDVLRKVGFSAVEILHKNAIFAAFGAVR